MSTPIAIVDIGLGNIRAVANMFRRVGANPMICQAPEQVHDFEHVVLPGVGAFDAGVKGLHTSGWGEYLTSVGPETKILGICLGMQLLADSSDEGDQRGLGLIPGHFVRFDSSKVVVPHMGWNEVRVVRDSPLFSDFERPPRFYFTHSFHAHCWAREDVLALAEYGTPFTAAYGRGHVFGVQFHPEKSHRFGMQLIKNFASL